MLSRALIFAPLGTDADAIAQEVEACGETGQVCATPAELAAAIEESGSEPALLAIVSQEGAGEETGEVFARAFAAEPTWARLPVIFLVTDARRPPPAVRHLDKKEHAPPFLVLERPTRPPVLRHAIQTQAEARRRQFETRDLLERLRAEETRGRYLLNELRHRTRNSLAVLQSLFSMSVRQASSVEELSTAFGERLRTLSRAYAQLSAEEKHERRLDALLAENVEPYTLSEGQLRLTGPPVAVDRRASFDLAMAIHELATNAAKHGALSRPTGRVEIEWEPEKETGELRLSWRERGGPPVEQPTKMGLGSRVIQYFPTTKPSARVEFERSGLRWTGWLPACTYDLSKADGA